MLWLMPNGYHVGVVTVATVTHVQGHSTFIAHIMHPPTELSGSLIFFLLHFVGRLCAGFFSTFGSHRF